MQNIGKLTLGEKIDLTVDGKSFYKTMIGDIFENGLIMVGAPIHRGKQMQFEVFDEVFLVFYRDTGRYFSQMRVVGFQEKDRVRYTMLEQMTEPVKDQRREFYRLPTSVEALLYEYADGIEVSITLKEEVGELNKIADARAKDISVTGIALITKRECLLSERYLIKLNFDEYRDKAPPLWACANVVRTELTLESGMYNLGMCFFGLTKDKSEFLSKYILTQQQKKIVQKKLVEGE